MQLNICQETNHTTIRFHHNRIQPSEKQPKAEQSIQYSMIDSFCSDPSSLCQSLSFPSILDAHCLLLKQMFI